MSYLHEYDDLTVEDIVARNSHELTAHLLLTARDHVYDLEARHRRELDALRSRLEQTHRVGFRVLAAEAKGRKTVRVADMVTDLPTMTRGDDL